MPARVAAWLIVSALSLTLWPATAAAQQLYWGFGMGFTRHDTSAADWDDGSLIDGGVSRSDFGFKLIASYEMNPRLAWEAAFVSLGEHSFEGRSDGGDFWLSGDVRGKASTLGVSGSGVVRWPIGERSSAYARGGLLYWNTDVTIDDERARESGGKTGASPLVGGGLEFELDRAMRVRVEWERYLNIEKGVFGKYDVDMLSASFLVTF
ncbi:outer membrane beta-barrel protein [Ectothiorhodospiraceae bacterium 2226]|nr:outer membrane beta-barrel protein [Ectothiorhodospiraceae bacterium 2226]